MRRDDDVFAGPERVPRRQRLGIGDVEASARERARVERRDQRLRIDDTTARDVDQVRAWLAERQALGVEKPFGRGRQRQRDRDDVGTRQEAIEIVGDTELVDERRRLARRSDGREHLHVERLRARRDLAADAPHSNDEHRTSRERRHLGREPAFPAAVALSVAPDREAPRQGEQTRERVLGDRGPVDAAHVREHETRMLTELGDPDVAIDTRAPGLDPAQLGRGS